MQIHQITTLRVYCWHFSNCGCLLQNFKKSPFSRKQQRLFK